MRVLVIDDDALVTNGLKTIIEKSTQQRSEPFTVVGTGDNGRVAIDLYHKLLPDVVLMDIRMPEMDGIEAGKRILQDDPQARIVYLTTFLEDDYIIEALRIGAKGYLLKTDFESIIPAIEAVMNNHQVFGSDIIARIPNLYSAEGITETSGFPELSEKENELIYWVAEGLNTKEIADKMHFSEGTIRNYLSIILDKLNLRDRTQLAIYYFKHLK
ncbi:response regulator transcription factor [Aerococcaceae bacterium DSM 111176]|nr:response regulator transcription factor [Aerococcaceae bacterium DSM 111176]